MEFKIEKIVPREVLENVFVTALEGGSNYWYFLSQEAVDKIRKVVPKTDEPFLSMAVLKAVLDHNVAVPINDAENEEDELGVISMKTFGERLQKLSLDEGSGWALRLEIDDCGDADSSDVVFQFLTMGEVVFG